MISSDEIVLSSSLFSESCWRTRDCKLDPVRSTEVGRDLLSDLALEGRGMGCCSAGCDGGGVSCWRFRAISLSAAAASWVDAPSTALAVVLGPPWKELWSCALAPDLLLESLFIICSIFLITGFL